MIVAVESEIRAQFAVDARQEVEVESGGDAQSVVVGRVKDSRILLEIDADEQAAARPAQAGDASEQIARGKGFKVADGRSRKINHAARRRVIEHGKRERACEVRLHRMHFQPGIQVATGCRRSVAIVRR